MMMRGMTNQELKEFYAEMVEYGEYQLASEAQKIMDARERRKDAFLRLITGNGKQDRSDKSGRLTRSRHVKRQSMSARRNAAASRVIRLYRRSNN